MKTIEVTEKEVAAAFDAAKSEEAKSILAALFCKRPKPNLDDYKSIQTYDDACIALDVYPVIPEMVPDHIKALMKLETISRALWGKDFEPKPNAEGTEHYYYPRFGLYTDKELERMTNDGKANFLSAHAYNGAHAGFGFLIVSNRSSFSHAYVGFRLCQQTEEKIIYFEKQFIELWAEYLSFNFKVGEHIK